ncbi:MAG: glycosyl transferase family 1 [Chloroflexi bacterium]|nr:MAG: glycosyl transferase family 1 [Chloroflexota bacterium]
MAYVSSRNGCRWRQSKYRNRTMRIGLISGEYPPDQGGVGDFTRELARALADIGHELHVITTKSPIPSLTAHRVMENWRWGCWKQILSLANELKLDVLNIQYQAAAYGMHPGINFVPRRDNRPPVVVTFHDLRVPYLFPKAGPLRRWVVNILARRAAGVIVTNAEDELRLANLRLANLLHIPIGSNIPLAPPLGYSRGAERARWGVGPDDLLLGYFGFLNESKGGEELMHTLALLVERGLPAHLLLIGGRVGSSDPANRAYAERVERLIGSLGLSERVHRSGYTRPETVSAGLLAADVCLLPYRDGVSFRRGTLHACLTHGRAIVTTRPAVELPQVRDGENMLLAEPRDSEGLAEAVARLAADPVLRARLETGAKALAAEFTWERIARQTAAFFRRL